MYTQAKSSLIRRSATRWVVALSLLNGSLAVASPPAEWIIQDFETADYIHFHQDLLMPFLGFDRAFSANHDQSRTRIFNELASHPTLSVALHPFVYQANTYNNVIATQQGTDFPTQIYVVGAHYDSVAGSPGADDNGTGTAIVVALADVLSHYRTPSTIKYCLFDREEQGLRGSTAWVASMAGQNIVMALTADMVGHDSGPYAMDIYGKPASMAAVNGIADAIDAYGNGLGTFLNFGNFAFSDHWPFEQAGIPAFVVIERTYNANTCYHQTCDAVNSSPTYINYAMVMDLVRSFAGFMVDEIGISLWHDADADADVDFADFAVFQRCFGQAATVGCTAFDFNQDHVINLVDFDTFLDAVTGP